MTGAGETRSNTWKWSVCGMLLLATMLNYMDRQTLAQTSLVILPELGLDRTQYGQLELYFGYAFACGGLCFGLLADRVRIYYFYPLVLVLWSITGFGAAYSVEIGALLGASGTSEQAYWGFCVCRTVLGFFEAAQWPFALVTTSRLLSRAERSMGNSILQSGTAIGSIFTPLVVQGFVTDQPGTWRLPFMVIGAIGLAWIVPWLLLMRPSDLSKPASVVAAPTEGAASPEAAAKFGSSLPADVFWRRFIVCAVMVVAVNLPWQFFRAWLPQFLEAHHGYDRTTINYFTAGYYVAADIGCIGVGFMVRWLVGKGWDVHWSRSLVYGACAASVAMGGLAAIVPAGPILFLILLTVGGAGLGLFPNYYSFSQDLSGKHQGIISGFLGFTTWTISAQMQGMVGNYIKRTDSFVEPMIWLSLAPLFAFVILLLVWKQWPPKHETPVE